MAKAQGGYFGRGLFDFFRELEENNNREWFTENKPRYLDHVEQPMLRFIGDFGERLKKIAPAFVALPTKTGGSLFRIHRDTRFSKDKSPYKTAVAAIFPHRDHPRNFGLPGFYIHLGPDERLGGGGIHGPQPPVLAQIRDRIVAKPTAWAAVRKRTELEGGGLKRAPAGYDPEHRFIEDIKRKDFYAMTRFTEAQVCAPGFMDTFAEACRDASALIEFLAAAAGISK